MSDVKESADGGGPGATVDNLALVLRRDTAAGLVRGALMLCRFYQASDLQTLAAMESELDEASALPGPEASRRMEEVARKVGEVLAERERKLTELRNARDAIRAQEDLRKAKTKLYPGTRSRRRRRR